MDEYSEDIPVKINTTAALDDPNEGNVLEKIPKKIRKARKPMSDAQKLALKNGREKAKLNQMKRMLLERETRLKKDGILEDTDNTIKDDIKDDIIDDVEEEPPQIIYKKKKKKKPPTIVHYSSSDDDEGSVKYTQHPPVSRVVFR